MHFNKLFKKTFFTVHKLSFTPSNLTFKMVAKKKKWSKGKVREKLANLVIFDKATHARLFKEIPKMKVITPAAVSERLKVNGSLARQGLKELVALGKIKCVSYNHRTKIYTKVAEAE